MKKIIFVVIAFLGFGLASCGNSSKKQTTDEKTVQSEVKTVDVEKALCLEDILAKAETEVGKEVVLKGKITHTCKHSGRRCFVVGKDDKTSIRVEAKGNIGGFNRELIGSVVAIKGILRENRMTEEDIDAMEAEYKKQQEAAKPGEGHCDTELKNIQGMRDWMKANNKEFYSIYYMDGMEFEVVE